MHLYKVNSNLLHMAVLTIIFVHLAEAKRAHLSSEYKENPDEGIQDSKAIIDDFRSRVSAAAGASMQTNPPLREVVNSSPKWEFSVFVRPAVDAGGHEATSKSAPNTTTAKPKITTNTASPRFGTATHSSINHEVTPAGDEEESRVTYDFSNLHNEWSDDETNPGSTRHSNGRSDICAKCLCSRDLHKVFCEYTEYETDMVILSADIIPKETRYIQIKNYKSVSVRGGTFASPDTNLVQIVFRNINNLQMESYSFNMSENARQNIEMTIKFINCNISTFPTEAITQAMKEEQHGAYSKINLRGIRFLSLVIHRCTIETIQEKAITNSRFIYLNISNTMMKKIEKRGFDVEVFELAFFKNNNVAPLQEDALCLHAKKVIFTGNYFEDIGNHSILIDIDNQVLFEFNHIKLIQGGGLKGINPISKYGSNIIFHRNIVYKAKPNSLDISETFPIHERKILNNTFFIECNCSIDEYFYLITGTDPSMLEFDDSFKILLRRSQCLKPFTKDQIIVSTYMEANCNPFPIVVVTSISMSFILFVIAIAVCVICSIRIRHLKETNKTLGETTSHSFSTLNRPFQESDIEVNSICNSTMSPLWIEKRRTAFPFALAMPEVKTYQQNEVNEFTEWTESIQGSTIGTLDIFRKNGKINNRASCPLN